MKKAFEILSVIGLLMIAAFFDMTYQDAKQVSLASFQSNLLSSLFWLRIFGTLLVTFLLLLAAWYLICWSSNDLVVTIVCIIVGTLVFLLVTIPGYYFMGQFNLSRSISGEWLADIISSDLSLTSHTAAFILGIGIFRLLPVPKKPC